MIFDCQGKSTSAESSTLFVVLPVNGKIFFHIIRRSEDHRDPLVDGGGLDVQNVHGSCSGHASCLLHDEGHGVALIQQPQLKRQQESN